MASCWEKGATVYLSKNDDPKRKLKYTWELTKTAGGYIGINTHLPNKIVKKAVESGSIEQLSGYSSIKSEVKYGDGSRIDLLLSDHPGKKNCFVEIKNVTLYDADNDQVTFPDAVTTRGQKHLKELSSVVKNGQRAVMFFLINRPEGKSFSPAHEIDPEYGKLLKQAVDEGVEVLAYRCRTDLNSQTVGEAVSIKI